MVEDDSRELLGGIVFTGFEPVRGDAELDCEFAQRAHARAAGVRLDPADVRVGDTLAGDVALAEAQCEPAFANPVPDGRHLWGEGIAVHSCPESSAPPDCDPPGAATEVRATGVSAW